MQMVYEDDITIVTPYVGQLLKIKKEATNSSLRVVVNEKDEERLMEMEGDCMKTDY